MKHLLALALILALATPSFAEMTFSDGMIKRIGGDKDSEYVDFSWKIRVESDREANCFFEISLRDGDEMEFKRVIEPVHIKPGHNLFTGTDIVKSSLWFQMKSSPMSLSTCTND